jgi:antitoxin MazE
VSLTKVGPKHQVTIPKEVFERLRLEIGDYLDVRIKGTTITMAPARIVPKDQAWFYTKEWQQKEREADEDIALRKLRGPFASADALIKDLNRLRKRKK